MFEGKPVILIAWGPCIEPQFNSHADMLTKAYEWAIAQNGGIPLVPLEQSCIEEYEKIADGLLIPGAMFFKSKKGISPLMKIEAQNRRESFQDALFEAFYAANKPIMGICEGHQKINCCLGGNLKLDLAQKSGVSHHSSAHIVYTKEGSLIHQIFGKEFIANSYHNFYIGNLGKDLEITAVSPEENCEALQHKNRPIYGFQFHPERMRGDEPFPPEGPCADPVWEFFIEKCKK